MMGLFKDTGKGKTAKQLAEEYLTVSESILEDGGSYEIFDDGTTIRVVLLTNKPVVIVGRDEWEQSKEELERSRKFARSLQETVRKRDEEIEKLKEEIQQLKVTLIERNATVVDRNNRIIELNNDATKNEKRIRVLERYVAKGVRNAKARRISQSK
jgi:predicted RNase H-like nuclease (RuvC/YqgF family)